MEEESSNSTKARGRNIECLENKGKCGQNSGALWGMLRGDIPIEIDIEKKFFNILITIQYNMCSI